MMECREFKFDNVHFRTFVAFFNVEQWKLDELLYSVDNFRTLN